MALVVRLLAYGFVNGSSLKLAFLLHSNLLTSPCFQLQKHRHSTSGVATRIGAEWLYDYTQMSLHENSTIV